MENRIAKLSLDDTIDDETKKEAEAEIQDKCVSFNCCNCYLKCNRVSFLGELHKRTQWNVCQN
jgi:hypothetical protein